MSTAAICRAALAVGPYRGSRLSVLGRRVRSLRGQGRAPDRRAPPYGAARALARRVADRDADAAFGAERGAARGRPAQPGAGRHRLSAGHPRRRAARPCVSAARRPDRPSWSPPARSISPRRKRSRRRAVAVITLPDNRWDRVDIKSIALLPNVLAKQAAREHGAREAWYVDKENRVTEGSSSNAWIVTRDGKVVTRQADHGILKGITRAVVIDTLRAHGLELEERPFTVEEAYAAREAFLTSASQTRHAGRADRRPPGRKRRAGPRFRRPEARFPSICRVFLRQFLAQTRPPDVVLACVIGVPSNEAPQVLVGFTRGDATWTNNATGAGARGQKWK